MLAKHMQSLSMGYPHKEELDELLRHMFSPEEAVSTLKKIECRTDREAVV